MEEAMQKITVRRIVLGSILLSMSIIAIVTLCFNVIYLDLDAVATGNNAAQTNIYADNGFSLIGRKSFFLTGLKEVRMKGADALITVCQICAILFLVMAVASLILTVLGFFFDKSEKTFITATILIMSEVIGFMVVGIVVRSVFISTCKNTDVINAIFGESITGSSAIALEKAIKAAIKTAAFVPFILATILLAGYITVAYVIKNNTLNVVKKDKVNDYAKYLMCDFRKIDVQYLRELKQLFDEGILTEEEFMEQKRLALGKKE